MTRRWFLLLVAMLLWDWAPWVPPIPMNTVAQVRAQTNLPPPSSWHPFRGGVNCVQVADVNGNFNCSPLVTIDPTTGVFISVLGGPFSQMVALTIGPLANPLVALGNDLVLAKQTSIIAPAGPGVGGATLRVRPSPVVPGYCRLVIAGGNSYNQEFPVALMNPAYAFLGQTGLGSGIPAVDIYVVDFPGGPGGC